MTESTVFEESDENYSKTIKSKENTLRNFLPVDQILYQESHAALIPPNHNRITIDGDVIGLNTEFDEQAALGKFTLESNHSIESPYSHEVKKFGLELNHCLKLRDKYQNYSSQEPIMNPINHDDWISYPKPQPKGWKYEYEYGSSDYYYDYKASSHFSGEKFDLKDYIETVFKNEVAKKDTKAKLIWKSSKFVISGFEGHPKLPNFKVFFNDLKHIITASIDRTGSLLSERRLIYLKTKFDTYSLLNEQREIYLTKLNPHRDFYNVRKVDNNVDMSMSMTKKHLLSVINDKLKTEPKRVVYIENGISMTLEEIFKPYFEDKDREETLNIDDLFELGIIDRDFTGDVVVLNDSTNYDSIIQSAALLRIDKTFLRVDNDINGEYLSDTLKQVFSDLEKSKYCFNELGLNFNLLSNYTGTRWGSLANWITDNKLISYNVKWVIRIPRNYAQLKRNGKVKSFREFLELIFGELFQISIDPSLNPKLHYFLTKISSFDLLSGGLNPDENESLFDFRHLTSPDNWTYDHNPPYCYYLYYIFTNLSNLNSYRRSRGLCTFNLRPHVASATAKSGGGIITESLSANFLLSRNIINGEKLINYPVLEYLYYLKQIGITMSPLCWNKTIQTLNDDERNIENSIKGRASYETNPAVNFFKIGLKIALSTNKPLFASLTREPLIEEYSIAASMHKLSGVDLCELARNSVLLSGFNGALKKHWIGIEYVDEKIIDHVDTDEFCIQRSNVPGMRLDYRRDTILLENEFIQELVASK